MQSILSMLMIWIVMGIICAIVAKSKSRNIYLWFTIGTFFSILGLLVLLLLPKVKKNSELGKSELAPVQSMNADSILPSEEADNFHNQSEPIKRIQSDPSLQWYYICESKDSVEVCGPCSVDVLRVTIAKLNLQLNTYIWCEEFADWSQISEFQNSSYLMDRDMIIGKGEEETYRENAPIAPSKKETLPEAKEGTEEATPEDPSGENIVKFKATPPAPTKKKPLK